MVTPGQMEGERTRAAGGGGGTSPLHGEEDPGGPRGYNIIRAGK